MTKQIQVVDSHTAGEPTRVVVDGFPDLGTGSLKERLELLRSSHDQFRTAVVREPRGSDVLVGALLCQPSEQACDAAVIFFNNVGYLGMCGHGMIGVVATLLHLQKVKAGQDELAIETPVGVVHARLTSDQQVCITNVPSYRKTADVSIDVPGVGNVVGDVAWGGNWFYLVRDPSPELSLQNVDQLQKSARLIRQAINANGFPEVDHVEFFGPPEHEDSHSRNFVLCPGLEYDRSPCGTGTSAKLACLAADEKLAPGDAWIQEGIVGTRFTGIYQWEDQSKQRILPTITGHAHVTAESTLLLNDDDPFQWGIV